MYRQAQQRANPYSVCMRHHLLPATIVLLATLPLAFGEPDTMHTTPATAEHAHTNRLAEQTSPYLLQHAHNPVNWYPWGPEAFAEAKRRQVPILVSVGYSTCYWCHVMERESFENETTAKIMNDRFVCIKVDREERPDVDDIYMAAVQLMTGSGGWPMNVWLTPPSADGTDPGLKPFYAGTYFPPEPKYGRPSFTQVCENLSEAWKTQNPQVLEQADRVTQAVREHLTADSESVRLDGRTVGMAVDGLLRMHDATHGGFGDAPKFPQPVYPMLLLEVMDQIEPEAQREKATDAVRKTLDAMALGGVYDQVGGGFHRYSTDAEWLVPHFEKMLYDNGQLATLYAKNYRKNKDEFDARIAKDICNYVLREMTLADGRFTSAQDAEVDSKEGLNYLWQASDLDVLVEREALTKDDAAFVLRVLGMAGGPNFQDPHHPEEPRRIILNMPQRHDALMAELSMDRSAFDEQLTHVRKVMLTERMTRKQPGLDDKVIVSWNALMIAGLANTAGATLERRYYDAAAQAARSILSTMRADDGGLLRTSRGDSVGTIPAFFEDYAFMVHALVALDIAATTFNDQQSAWRAQAVALSNEAKTRFGDGPLQAMMYDTLPGQSDLLVRQRSTRDGAVPSAISIWINAHIDLFELSGERQHLEYAIACLGAISKEIEANPMACVNSVRALHRLLEHDGSLPDKLGAEPITKPVDSPVAIHAAVERIAVPKTGAARLPIRIEIEDVQFHINAARIDPKLEELGMQPLTVSLVGGTGYTLELAFPKGKDFEGPLIGDDFPPLQVYQGAIEGAIVVSRTDEAITGRPRIALTYQVCSESVCFNPMTVELDVELFIK